MAPISKKRHILDSFLFENMSNTSNHSNFSDSDSNASLMVGSSNGSMTLDSRSSSDIFSVPRQFARVNRVILDKNSDEYRKRRERNNLAVKKSRTKSKLKSIETSQTVSMLKAENDHLQREVELLSRELRCLKDIFVAHAINAHGIKISECDLNLLTGPEVHQARVESPRSAYSPVSPSPMSPLPHLPYDGHHRGFRAHSLSIGSRSSHQDSEDDF